MPHAALIIIGANVGSSSTAVLASVGANANARRVAASHVLFNVVTAVFAVAILPWLLPAVAAVAVILGLPADPAVTLALFSTTFNGLGVVLMLPVTAAMVRFLRRRFVTPEEELARPRYLDPAALAVPEQALRDLEREVRGLGRFALRLAIDAARGPGANPAGLGKRAAAIDALGDNIRSIVGRVSRLGLAPDIADALAPLLRAMQHYEELATLASEAPPRAETSISELSGVSQRFIAALVAGFAASDTSEPDFDIETLRQAAASTEQVYTALKQALLRPAAAGRMTVADMDDRMKDIGRLHRGLDRAVKAAYRLESAAPSSQA